MLYRTISKLLGRVIELPYCGNVAPGLWPTEQVSGWCCVTTADGISSIIARHSCAQCRVIPGNPPPGGVSFWPDLREIAADGTVNREFGCGMHGSFTSFKLLGFGGWQMRWRPIPGRPHSGEFRLQP